MPNARPLLIASVASLALVLVNVAPPVLGLGSQPAFAKNDKDDDGDRGNGHGNGHDKGDANDDGGRDGNAAGGRDDTRSVSVEQVITSPKGRSASAPGQNKSSEAPASTSMATSTKAAKTPGPEAKIARLHAANANLQAFLHASPNSTLGQIAAYAQATVAVEAAVAVLDDALAELGDTTEAEAAAQAAYDASVMFLTGSYPYADTSDAALQAELVALNSELATTTDPYRIGQLEVEIAAIDTVLARSAELAAARLAPDGSPEGLANLEDDIADAQVAAETALTAAAGGTPVDPTAKEWVDAQLQAGGVLDYYRSTILTPVP